MNINQNHKEDGEQAWKESGLHYGQTIKYQGKYYKAIDIGYGALLKGKLRISDNRESFVVNVIDVEVVK